MMLGVSVRGRVIFFLHEEVVKACVAVGEEGDVGVVLVWRGSVEGLTLIFFRISVT